MADNELSKELPKETIQLQTPRDSISGIQTGINLDNLLNYTSIFTNHTQAKNDILFLKKQEYDIFYSCQNKYPILVKESISPLTGTTDPNNAPIDRRKIEDPFREDLDIPARYRHTLDDYLAYMEYGGSMGHNAPAGHHKTNMEIFSETFLLSNITPQDMVFNSGLWVVMENWCKMLGRFTKLQNISVITGSIPERQYHIFDKVRMNVPTRMFKIIIFQLSPRHTKKTSYSHSDSNSKGSKSSNYKSGKDKSGKDKIFMEILMANNAPYNVSYTANKIDLAPYLLPIRSWEWFQRVSGINLARLLAFYGYDIKYTPQYSSVNSKSTSTGNLASISYSNVKPFRWFINMEFTPSPNLKLLLKKSYWFGQLIYAPDIDTLNYRWEQCQKLETEFETLQYHKQYYELTMRRINRENKLSSLPSISKKFSSSRKLWQKLSKKNTTNTTKTTKTKISIKR